MFSPLHERADATAASPHGVSPRPCLLFPGTGLSRPRGRPAVPRSGALAIGAVALALLAGCARLAGHEATPAGPGVPKVLTARFDPDTVRAGEETILVVTFEDSEGDVVEVYLVERVVSDFRLVSSTSVVNRNIRRHFGQIVGTIRESFRWDAPAIRFYDVYIVDLKGNASNRIPVRVTVR